MQNDTIDLVDLLSYDHYIVFFSGGKDCTAAFLHLLDLGVPKERIELWHHLVDGSPEEKAFMDWECTEDYCRKFAAAFNVPIYFSWLDGGFKREMLRNNQAKAATYFETPEALLVGGGKSNNKTTRLKFPQVAADLKVRWCSAYLKRDVAEMALKNQERFIGKQILAISGERAEESSARAKYAYFETDHASTNTRNIFRFRPVHQWKEEMVWQIIEKYGVIAHPCYYLGYSRCSCRDCIFGDADQFATSYFIAPDLVEEKMDYETQFGVTIKRKESLRMLVTKGTIYAAAMNNPELVKQSRSKEYVLPIFTDQWQLPAGAYSKNVGPL